VEQRPLHWSEQAKMHAGSAGPSGQTRRSTPQRPPRQHRSSRSHSPRRSFGKGFWITLSFVLCAAAAAAMIFFWYLPGREGDADKGTFAITPVEISEADRAARELIREAMTVIESAHADSDTYAPEVMTPGVLAGIEPGITFIAWPDETAFAQPTARAAAYCVNYHGTESRYSIGTMSASGNTFGVIVDNEAGRTERLFWNGEERDWSTLVGSAGTPWGPPASPISLLVR
jgi:hypothetical protein